MDPLATVDRAGLALFAAIGLLGGAHCLGMCGPFVSTYAERLDRGNALTWREIRGHALFNLGRTASYALIGCILGLLGGVVFDAAVVLTVGDAIRGVAGIAAGGVIAVAGVSYLSRGTGAFPDARIGHGGSVGRVLARVTGTISDRIDDWVRGPRIALLGALHGLLPCPILYPAFLYAFAIGDPMTGALSLGVLGLGTFPTLFLYGTAFGTLSSGTRSRLHRALGVAFVVLAYLPLSMGLASLGIDLPRLEVPIYQPLAG